MYEIDVRSAVCDDDEDGCMMNDGLSDIRYPISSREDEIAGTYLPRACDDGRYMELWFKRLLASRPTDSV